MEILKRLMQNEGDTTYSLAEKTGISQPTISRILKGKHGDLKQSTLVSLAKAYNVKVSQLLGEIPIEIGIGGSQVEIFYVIDEERKVLHRQSDEIPQENLPQAKKLLDVVKELPYDRKKES